MFIKLLKHDAKSVGRICLPLTLGAVLLAIFGFLAAIIHLLINEFSPDLFELSYKAFEEGKEGLSIFYDLLSVASMLLSFACGLSMFVVFVSFVGFSLAVLVLVVVNFYKTLITDQGYLTFTLPVSPSKILLSKIVNGTFWTILITAVAFLGTALILAPSAIFNEYGFVRILIDSLIADLNPITVVLIAFLYFATGFVALIVSLIYDFFCVFLGGVVTPKGKFITGAAFVVIGHIACYIIFEVISTVINLVSLGFLFLGIYAGWISDNISFDIFLIPSIIAMVIFLILLIVGGLVFYSVTRNLMTRKLNLP